MELGCNALVMQYSGSSVSCMYVNFEEIYHYSSCYRIVCPFQCINDVYICKSFLKPFKGQTFKKVIRMLLVVSKLKYVCILKSIFKVEKCGKQSETGLSASSVGGSLTLAWATLAGYVPDCVTSIKCLVHQNFIIVTIFFYVKRTFQIL